MKYITTEPDPFKYATSYKPSRESIFSAVVGGFVCLTFVASMILLALLII